MTEDEVDADPIRQFHDWHAGAGSPPEVAVATASADGAPAVRMVLLKSADERGFVFFTNYGSAKRTAGAGSPPEVAVATASADGAPAVRMVLLKSADE
ncbi:MAG TPA: pyridoxamine 5'-phosphate oxidase family protein, partial [Acidimicrobiales bacterium]|nr:pyridoxamine 5'-phosphate oxidase family protein [Acidimicrobiales bacterium]